MMVTELTCTFTDKLWVFTEEVLIPFEIYHAASMVSRAHHVTDRITKHYSLGN